MYEYNGGGHNHRCLKDDVSTCEGLNGNLTDHATAISSIPFPLAGKMILLRHKKSPRRKASGEYCRLHRIAYYHLITVGKGKEKKRNRQIFRDNFWHDANI